MQTVIQKFFKKRELLAKVLLYVLVPFIMIGCSSNNAGSSSDTTPPTFTSAPTISVAENQTSAIILQATDNASTVTFTISGTDSASFDINSTSGVVSFKVAPDYETKTSYTFTATATDTSNNNATQNVTIYITDVNEVLNQAPTINTTFSNLSIEENNGTTNYEINISDSNGDSLTLSVESNNTSILKVSPNWTNPISQATYSSALDFNLSTETNATGSVKITLILSDNESNITASFDINVTELFQSGEIWKGLTYNTVISPYTGKVWLDKNLGASQVCSALDDAACYGDYYQWGRDTDGHEKSDSATSSTQATDIINVGSSFFINYLDWTTADSDGALRAANWSKADGTSVCPIGYRVPTITELEAETIAASTAVTNNTDAFNNFLKLPSAGYRDSSDGTMRVQGSYGIVWSSSVNSSYSRDLYFDNLLADSGSGYRPHGFGVRCLKD